MPEPFSWNAVIIGAWNPVILSPDGVRRRLFELPETTLIEIEVSVDRPGPFRIGHDGIVVVPTSSRLEVTSHEANPAMLQRACEIGRRALAVLPETPVSAVGINIRYRFQELPDAVFDLLRAPLDGVLADHGYQVDTATTKRALRLPPGVINLQVVQTGGGGTLEFNFHRESVAPAELSEWLQRVPEFVTLSDQVAEAMGIADVRREIHA